MAYRVLILHNYYSEKDGSSVALRGYLKDNKEILYYKILSRNVDYWDINIKEVHNWEEVRDELINEEYDIIHNFRILGYDLFQWTIKSLKKLGKSIKIITTINQRPSFVNALISPQEIKYSDKIVFIDSTAYNDSLLKFIPDFRKSRIYYCTSLFKDLYTNLYLERKSRVRNNVVKFGRGSTVNKCPEDMIDNFLKVRYDKKEFHIVGIPENSWVYNEASKYSNVITYPLLPNKEWLNVLKDMDIFLYQLPLSAYSSLDGTLGAAMLLGIPVVYYGPDAPKERFVNGINGFVAENKQQLIDYCTKLANDDKLRTKVGDAGRESTLKQFNWKDTVNSYNEIYGLNRETEKIKVPLSYRVFFFRKLFIPYFKWHFKDTFVEKIYRKIKHC